MPISNEWIKNKRKNKIKEILNKISKIIIVSAIIAVISYFIYDDLKDQKNKIDFLQKKETTYKNPEMQNMHNEIKEVLDNNHIIYKNLIMNEEENGTIGSYYEYDPISYIKVKETKKELENILDKYAKKIGKQKYKIQLEKTKTQNLK